jgi:hypothetical protein
MRTILIGAAGAALLAISSPAMAQVHVHTDAPGLGVHIDSGRHYQRHRGHHHRHQGWRARAQCREVTTRTVRPNGTVVVRKRIRC